jgi:hypothetical protein
MKPSWLTTVFSWLPGVREVSAPCPVRVEPQTTWVPPPLRHVHADEQARAIVAAWQEAGEAGGAIPRGRIFNVYQVEHCEMFGFHPIRFNALCEALGKICEKRRIWSEGHKVTAYVIPGLPKRRHLSMVPSAHLDDIPWPELPKRARTGSSHAQA